MKFKKKRKAKRMRGSGTHGWGARKKHMGSGHHGGFGMAGTGKRADQKKTLVLKLYGSNYFGKQGITSKGTRRRKNNVMNVRDIAKNINSIKKEYADKDGVIKLKGYKILGEGDINVKVIIKAKAASLSAIEKIKKAGGDVILEKRESKEE